LRAQNAQIWAAQHPDRNRADGRAERQFYFFWPIGQLSESAWGIIVVP
jgi:hypothetical protein